MKTSALLFLFLLPFMVFSQSNSVLSTGDWYKISVEVIGEDDGSFDP